MKRAPQIADNKDGIAAKDPPVSLREALRARAQRAQKGAADGHRFTQITVRHLTTQSTRSTQSTPVH
jgi:hypothetical protein